MLVGSEDLDIVVMETLGKDIVALDCEMVGVGRKGRVNALARISIVDVKGEVLLDKLVGCDKEIKDYRTEHSGVTREMMETAEPFQDVRAEALEILAGKIIVGHSLESDFDAMKWYCSNEIRDTAEHFKQGEKMPKLKTLFEENFGVEIQSVEHDSVEDARAVMKIYLKFREEMDANCDSYQLMTYSWESLESLPSDHVFCRNIKELCPTQEDKVRWASEWIKRRDKRPRLKSRGQGKRKAMDLGLQSALNLLSYSQLRKWIKKKEDQIALKKEKEKMKNRRQRLKRKEKSELVSQETIYEALTFLFSEKTPTTKLKVKKVKFKYDTLSLHTLPPDHMFLQRFQDDLFKGLKTKAESQEAQAKWATEWIKRRSDRDDFNVETKKIAKMTIQEALNSLSNQQLQLWINGHSQMYKLLTFNDLQYLPSDHIFTVNFLEIFSPFKSQLERQREHVRWATEWLKYRNDRDGSPKTMTLKQVKFIDALNLLSNQQLQHWIDYQNVKIELEEMTQKCMELKSKLILMEKNGL